MAFERVDVRGPEPPELSQPGIELLKWLRLQPVKPPLRVHPGLHEASLPQHSQVLGHGRLGHTKPALDLPHRLLRPNQQAQDRAAVGLRNNFEDGLHALYILNNAYTCQRIFSGGEGRGLWKTVEKLSEPQGCRGYKMRGHDVVPGARETR